MARSKAEALLVLRAQSGDREALEALLSGVQAELLRYAGGIAGSWAAEDVLQNTLLEICRKLKWLREPELFRPWAYRIASRAAFALLKRERRLGPPEPDTAAVEALPAPGDPRIAELFSEMPALLERISPASRAVLLLHYGQDLSVEETAAVLDIGVGTAKSRLAYGLSCLRTSMKEDKRV